MSKYFTENMASAIFSSQIILYTNSSNWWSQTLSPSIAVVRPALPSKMKENIKIELLILFGTNFVF